MVEERVQDKKWVTRVDEEDESPGKTVREEDVVFRSSFSKRISRFTVHPN